MENSFAPQHLLSVEVDHSSPAFITDVPASARSSNSIHRRISIPEKHPQKSAAVGEIDVINGIMERMVLKTKKINPDSPRTQQALSNLGIEKEECFLKKFANFETTTKNEKMKKLLYIYYIGHTNDTINQVLQERDKIKRKKERKMSFELNLGATSPKISVPISAESARSHNTPFVCLNLGQRLEKLDDRKRKDIQLIERQTMNFLESERDFKKQNERLNERLEKAEQKKRLMDEKKKKEFCDRKEKYSQSLENSKRMNEEKRENKKIESLHSRTKSLKEFIRVAIRNLYISYQELFHKEIERRQQHKLREQKIFEEQRKVELRIEKREEDSNAKSLMAFGEFIHKDMHAHEVMQRDKWMKKMALNKKERFNQMRAQQAHSEYFEEPQLLTKFAEKMQRSQKHIEKIEKERQKERMSQKQEREEHFNKIKDNLEQIQRDYNLKEELLSEKITEQTERMEHFYTARQQFWDHKVDMNRFKTHRTQIHFDKITADDMHKCNVIMAKNRVWREALQKKQKEKEVIKNKSMQSRWNLQAEKDSLRNHLEQVCKIQASTEKIAGNLEKTKMTFNVQGMANYIYKNFNNTPQIRKSESQSEI